MLVELTTSGQEYFFLNIFHCNVILIYKTLLRLLFQDNYVLTTLTERTVERAEKLVKKGMKCGVSWGKVEDMPLNAEKLCESGICFVCQ